VVFAAVLALVALAVADTAPATVRPDAGRGPHGVGVASGSGYTTGMYGAPPAISLAPQTSGTHSGGTGGRAYVTGMYGAPQALALAPATSGRDAEAIGATPFGITNDGFDWSSAGAGVAIAFGLIMLVGTAGLAARRLRAGTAT
jgi:hypothetical protein